MPIICPSILASDDQAYHYQIKKIAHFATRIQIDLTDGIFAKSKTIDPKDAWWPVGVKADFHLMYKNPTTAVKIILEHQPNMIIVHSEADGNFEAFSNLCRKHNVAVGVAVLTRTPVEVILPAIELIDHILIFSGDLGKFGGRANLDLLDKVDAIKQRSPNVEIGWDGGVNDQNISHLVAGGVDVLNVGGFIQNSPQPEHAYKVLERIADETGTT